MEPAKQKPADLVGVNKDSYLILEALPDEFDSRVKAIKVDEKPTEEFNDVGGLDTQIQELIEAVVLPMTHKERFDNIGIKPPKGALMYGPPGTGKTLMARACAARTQACFLKLAGPQLVQMFIGDGAKLVRDAFKLAKEKQPAMIFIDELDAVGTKRFDSELSGDREVQRTMLELLNQLDGFTSAENIKVIAATNRVDILDPALLRSGRIDGRSSSRCRRRRARAHPPDPLAQDERQRPGQLRGARPLHRRLQRRAVGRLRRVTCSRCGATRRRSITRTLSRDHRRPDRRRPPRLLRVTRADGGAAAPPEGAHATGCVGGDSVCAQNATRCDTPPSLEAATLCGGGEGGGSRASITERGARGGASRVCERGTQCSAAAGTRVPPLRSPSVNWAPDRSLVVWRQAMQRAPHVASVSRRDARR